MKKDPKIFIEHILESILKIESFSKGLTRENFFKDELRQSAVIRQLEIIGEAAKNIPESFRIKYSIIEWKKIAGTRDKLSHGYFGVDLSTVWDVIKDDLPELKKNIEKIIKDYNK